MNIKESAIMIQMCDKHNQQKSLSEMEVINRRVNDAFMVQIFYSFRTDC